MIVSFFTGAHRYRQETGRAEIYPTLDGSFHGNLRVKMRTAADQLKHILPNQWLSG
jgi:hypothetical protein